MAHDERTRERARSFGKVARAYDRLRPEPPDEALEWLLAPGSASVVELGAGTGILTRKLLTRAPRVLAVEPDPLMREVLADRAQGADIVDAHAEELPVPDASVDTVIASSAWHWVDEERAVPEVARVLRPGGSFALLWNGPDRSVPWMRSLWAGGRQLSEAEASALDAERHDRHRADLRGSRAFTEPERLLLKWVRPMTRQDLVGLAGTYSAVLTMEASERERYLNAMTVFLDTHEATAGLDVIDVPMRCLCWRSIHR